MMKNNKYQVHLNIKNVIYSVKNKIDKLKSIIRLLLIMTYHRKIKESRPYIFHLFRKHMPNI